MYISALMLQEVLKEPAWMERMKSEDLPQVFELVYRADHARSWTALSATQD
jgi:hypothetical protein